MDELYALDDKLFKADNKFKIFDLSVKRFMIWTDFIRINKTHFKA